MIVFIDVVTDKDVNEHDTQVRVVGTVAGKSDTVCCHGTRRYVHLFDLFAVVKQTSKQHNVSAHDQTIII